MLSTDHQAAKPTRRAANTVNCLLAGKQIPKGSMSLDDALRHLSSAEDLPGIYTVEQTDADVAGASPITPPADDHDHKSDEPAVPDWTEERAEDPPQAPDDANEGRG